MSNRERQRDHSRSAPLWSHTAQFEVTPTSASRARAFVLQHLVDHRLNNLADRVRLVASELASNALVHAQTAFSITLAADDHAVVLTVRDDSPSRPVQRAVQATGASGRGLGIVELMSTEWGVDERDADSKSVWASFAIG
jgi:anti-sigma regulatory factor (Ser/Thr protein kinase)